RPRRGRQTLAGTAAAAVQDLASRKMRRSHRAAYRKATTRSHTAMASAAAAARGRFARTSNRRLDLEAKFPAAVSWLPHQQIGSDELSPLSADSFERPAFGARDRACSFIT